MICVGVTTILLQYAGTSKISSAVPSRKLCKANWVSFSDEAREQLGSGSLGISIDEFSEKLIAIATDIISKSKFCHQKRNTVWFNDSWYHTLHMHTIRQFTVRLDFCCFILCICEGYQGDQVIVGHAITGCL